MLSSNHALVAAQIKLCSKNLYVDNIFWEGKKWAFHRMCSEHCKSDPIKKNVSPRKSENKKINTRISPGIPAFPCWCVVLHVFLEWTSKRNPHFPSQPRLHLFVRLWSRGLYSYSQRLRRCSLRTQSSLRVFRMEPPPNQPLRQAKILFKNFFL